MSGFFDFSTQDRVAYPGFSDPKDWIPKTYTKFRNNKQALRAQKRKAIAKRRHRRFLFGRS
jgi:hypothetical protein